MKNEIIKFRCSAEEKEKIINRAKKSNLTTSEFCRQQAMKGEVTVPPKFTDEEISFYKALLAHNQNWIRITNLLRNRHPEFTQAI